MAMLICTVGNRDLLLDGKPVDPSESRSKGEELSNSIKRDTSILNRLECRIINKAVRFVLDKEKSIRRFILIGTNQPGDVADSLRSKDTFFIARIIAEYYRELYGSRKGLACIEVDEWNQPRPAMDEALDFFRQRLNKNRYAVEDGESVYLETNGGIPGINFGLFLASLEKFGEHLVPLWISESATSAWPNGLVGRMIEQKKRELFRQFLERDDYGASAQVAGNDCTRYLCLYAKTRYDLDFEMAEKHLCSAYENAPSYLRSEIEKFRESLTKVRDDVKETVLEEVFANAEIKLVRQEYSDFVVRIFRLIEGCYQYIVEKITGIADIRAYGNRAWTEYLENNPGIKKHLEEGLTENRKPLRISDPETLIMKRFCDYFITNKDKQDVIPNLEENVNALEKYDELRQIRNRSLIVHGSGGVSEQEIYEAHGSDPLSGFKKVFENLSLNTENHFKKLANLLLQR